MSDFWLHLLLTMVGSVLIALVLLRLILGKIPKKNDALLAKEAEVKHKAVVGTLNRRTLSVELAYDSCIAVIPIEDQNWIVRLTESTVLQKFGDAVDAFRNTDSGSNGCSAEFKIIPSTIMFGFELVSTGND